MLSKNLTLMKGGDKIRLAKLLTIPGNVIRELGKQTSKSITK
jgi:hypothetical protein